jgi:hypothetical protein
VKLGRIDDIQLFVGGLEIDGEDHEITITVLIGGAPAFIMPLNRAQARDVATGLLELAGKDDYA